MPVAPKPRKKRTRQLSRNTARQRSLSLSVVTIARKWLFDACTKTLVAPLEFIKITQQTSVTSATSIIQKYGVTCLWRGNLSNVIRFIPSFYLNHYLRRKCMSLFGVHDPMKDYWKHWISNLFVGSTCASITMLLIYPFDFTRTALVSHPDGHTFSGHVQCLIHAVKTHGITSIYRGYLSSVWCIFMHRAVFHTSYDFISFWLFKSASSEGSFWRRWMLAQCLSIAAGWLTHPIDTVRRGMMLTNGSELSVYNRIATERGIIGLTAGSISGALISLLSSISMTVVSQIG